MQAKSKIVASGEDCFFSLVCFERLAHDNL